jgi:subtilase family serine protease
MNFKENKRILLIAVIMLMISIAFFVSGYSNTTGAFKLEHRIPDLIVSEANMSEIEITGKIYNEGTSASRSFSVSFYERKAGSNGPWEHIGNQNIAIGLKSEKYKDFSQEWNPEVLGEREIKIEVDSSNRIRESDEENNYLLISKSAKLVNPDLQPININVDGNLVKIIIQNKGLPVSDFNCEIYTVKNNERAIISEEQVDSMESEIIIQTAFEAPELPYTIGVIVDADINIPESNEDNNILEILIE